LVWFWFLRFGSWWLRLVFVGMSVWFGLVWFPALPSLWSFLVSACSAAENLFKQLPNHSFLSLFFFFPSHGALLYTLYPALENGRLRCCRPFSLFSIHRSGKRSLDVFCFISLSFLFTKAAVPKPRIVSTRWWRLLFSWEDPCLLVCFAVF